MKIKSVALLSIATLLTFNAFAMEEGIVRFGQKRSADTASDEQEKTIILGAGQIGTYMTEEDAKSEDLTPNGLKTLIEQFPVELASKISQYVVSNNSTIPSLIWDNLSWLFQEDGTSCCAKYWLSQDEKEWIRPKKAELIGYPEDGPSYNDKFSIWAVAFSSDGAKIATVGSKPNDCPYLLKIWDAGSLACTRTVVLDDILGKNRGYFSDGMQRPKGSVISIKSLSFWQKDKIIAIGNDAKNNGEIVLFNAENGKLIQRLNTNQASSLSLNPDNKHILVAGSDHLGYAHIWNSEAQERCTSFAHDQRQADSPYFFDSNLCNRINISAAYSPDGNLVATGNYDRVIIWDAQTGEKKYTIACNKVLFEEKEVESLTKQKLIFFSNTKLLICSDDDACTIYDIDSGKSQKIPYPEKSCALLDASFNSEENLLVLSFESGIIAIIDIMTLAPIWIFPKGDHTSPINSVAFSPDGKKIVVGDRDKNPKIWDISQLIEVKNYLHNSLSLQDAGYVTALHKTWIEEMASTQNIDPKVEDDVINGIVIFLRKTINTIRNDKNNRENG